MHDLKINMEIFRHYLKIPEKAESCVFLGGKVENYFIIKLFRILRWFLISVVKRPLSACRLMFSDICAQAQVSEWMSSSVLPEPLHKRDVDKNGLRKVQPKS